MHKDLIWHCFVALISKRFDDPELFPMTVIHKNHKLTFDKSADEKIVMKIDDKQMFEYQFLNMMFSLYKFRMSSRL